MADIAGMFKADEYSEVVAGEFGTDLDIVRTAARLVPDQAA